MSQKSIKSPNPKVNPEKRDVQYQQFSINDQGTPPDRSPVNSTEPSKGTKEIKKEKAKKAKNPSKSFKRVFSYAWRNKEYLFTGLIGLLFSSLSSAVMPYLSGQIIDEISKGSDVDQLSDKCLILGLVSIVVGVFGFVRAFSFNLLGEKVMYNVRNDLYCKILNKDTEFFDQNKSGELMSRITSDTTLLQSAASDNISILLRNFVQFVGSLGFLWVLSYKLTLIMFSVVPPVLIVVALFIKFFKKYKVEYQDKLSVANGLATEAIGNIRVVKSFGNEQKECDNFMAELFKTYSVGYKKTLLQASFLGFIQIIGSGIILMVLYFGGKMVIDGEITIGDLSGFILYTITMSGGLIGMGNSITVNITATGVAEHLFELMDLEPKIQSGDVKSNKMNGEIKLNNVTFAYPSKEDVKVLKNVNMDIEPGKSVAIVGQSGSGKSSIVSLIERFYDVQEGQVMVDNVDIKDLNSEYLHQSIGFVSQEPTLFSGTLKDNIVYGVKDYTLDDIDKAIKMANAYDFIHNETLFPLGLDTIVGERGVKLSGGQKQRIAIARALIKNPSVLIFDEATSALDAESEYQVQYAIDQLVKQGDKTILIIAHRLSTIINCDKIIVLQNGELVEEGSHQVLLEKNNIYSKLIQRQLANQQQQQE